jgi:glycine/D-amino acid oxidase-like deaminating enzyme
MMTDLNLSPAADAIVFAFNAEHSGWVQDPQYLPAIAAALRAAAGVITFPGPESLLAIADELDAGDT